MLDGSLLLLSKYIYFLGRESYTGGQYVWVKWPQEKWACDFHDDVMPLPFQLQVIEVFFKISYFFIMEKWSVFSRILSQIWKS